MPKKTTIAAASLLAVATGVSAAEEDGDIRLQINGAETTTFAAECTVTKANGEEEALTVEETVPFEHSFTGESIRCAVTQTSPEGELEVDIRKDGNVSRARTRGHETTVNVRLR